MPRKAARTLPCATPLACASTQELLDEIRRRSLGCLLVCVRVEENGDAWAYALKGSPIMLGAMSAALSMETTRWLNRAGADMPRAGGSGAGDGDGDGNGDGNHSGAEAAAQ